VLGAAELDQLGSWIYHSADGATSTFQVTPTQAERKTGHLIGQAPDGGSVVFDKIDGDVDGDGYYEVEVNEDTLARPLRDWVYDLVDKDIPRDFPE
jgi:hypothetical protein